jgi:SNF family Na+-dependent transporter
MEWACVTLGMGWWVACACAILKSAYLGPLIHAVYFVAYVTAALGAACLVGNMWQYAVARRNAYERQQYKIITVTLAFTLAGVSLMGLRPGLA